MKIYPVILCGGAGSRLWPASRPERPKPFLDLVGDASLFQQAVARALPLMQPNARLLVVAGGGHRAWVEHELASVAAPASVLLEPEARESAAAAAAAALYAHDLDPEAILLILAADHHIPDAAAFQSAIRAGLPAATEGRIVTLGVRPREASTAYGYIRPAGPGLSKVETFREKPERPVAETYVAEGWLWNSGMFLLSARTLLDEMRAFAPDVLDAVGRSMPAPADGSMWLGEAFRATPRISLDRAVMERSDRLSVLPVDFEWSDLGAWDAVAATRVGDRGVHVGDAVSPGLVRAAPGMVVATAGVSNLVIIAERDAVLVCDLNHTQAVRRLADEAEQAARRRAVPGEGMADGARAFSDWLSLSALPLWATLGVEPDGGFVDALDGSGRSTATYRRARVQTRQAYVYAVAGRHGWPGPWAALVRATLDRFETTNLRPDGLYRTRVSPDGAVLDDTASLYDQAFALLAFAAAAESGVQAEEMGHRAQRLIAAMNVLRVEGGWREDAGHPFQANAHMHLLEACLAWEALEPTGGWTARADSIVQLARRAFIDPEAGFLREFFQADWSPAPGSEGRLVEPGHQFEWAWLLTRWGRSRNDDWARSAARKLYAVGSRGVDAARGVVFDELDIDLSIRSSRARLWPQTERLKAALILAEDAAEDRAGFLADAAAALAGLRLYLQPSGLWRDKMGADGAFGSEPAPASSLYHIMAAHEQLRATAGRLPQLGGTVT